MPIIYIFIKNKIGREPYINALDLKETNNETFSSDTNTDTPLASHAVLPEVTAATEQAVGGGEVRWPLPSPVLRALGHSRSHPPVSVPGVAAVQGPADRNINKDWQDCPGCRDLWRTV